MNRLLISLLAAAGIGSFVMLLTHAQDSRDTGAGLFGFFLLGAILSSWIGNALRMVHPRR